MITLKVINFDEYSRKWDFDQSLKQKKFIYLNFDSYGLLHDEIKKKITNFNHDNSELFEVIYMIHKWGGVTGRYFIMNRKGGSNLEKFKQNERQIDIYKRAISRAVNGDPSAFDLFCEIKGIGASFAGKHAYFWSMPHRPMIIVDRLVANFFGLNTSEALIKKFGSYSLLYDFFEDQREILGLKSVLDLERGIFQYQREKK